MRLETYKMAMSILLKFLSLQYNMWITVWHIEVSDGSLFCIFHVLSINLLFDRTCPLNMKFIMTDIQFTPLNSILLFMLNILLANILPAEYSDEDRAGWYLTAMNGPTAKIRGIFQKFESCRVQRHKNFSHLVPKT